MSSENASIDLLDERKIAVIGCGKMGGAIVGGLHAAGVPPKRLLAHDLDAERVAELSATSCTLEEACVHADILVLAVKPRLIPELLTQVEDISVRVGRINPAVPPEPGSRPILISVAAGVTLDAMRAHADSMQYALVRAMPNTPVAERMGMTALCLDGNVTEDESALARALFSTVGQCIVLRGEELMHAFTALAGSGPAFVFTLADALADAAVSEGLDREAAREIAASTIMGAGALLRAAGGSSSPAELRDAVASPSGTTIEGLLALEEHGFRHAAAAAVRAAARRSRRMSRPRGGRRSR